MGFDPILRNCVGSRSYELRKNLDKTTETELICHTPLLATPERVRKQVRNLHLSLGGFETLHVRVTRTSGPRYPAQFDCKKISQGGVSLLGGSQIKNPEEEEPPFKLLKSINFGGGSSGGWFFLRVLGLETTQQIHSPGGGGFLQSNTHNQF